MKNGLYTVDRIEEGFFVLENRETLETINYKIEDLACDAKEGDIVELIFDEAGKIIEFKVCEALKNKVLEENRKKLGSLFDN